MTININELSYPFDPTGKLASNKITGEQHIITATNWRDYHFIIPRGAPFFGTGVELTIRGLDGVVRNLTMGKDYYLTHQFHDASLACASPVFGSISFNDTQLAGVVTIKSYQLLGGIWSIDEAKIAEILAERLRNPRITTWEQVVDLPAAFPVIDHEWNLVDMVGMSQVVLSLNGIENQLRLMGQEGLANHLADFENPHRVTKAQVLLGLVRNLATATAAVAIAGTSDDFYITPYSLKAAMDAGPTAAIRAHAARIDNPHGMTAAQIGAWTAAETMIELNKKLGKYEVAADSSMFAGRTDVAFKGWVLEGTSLNSAHFGGYTTSEYAELIKQQISVELGAGYTKPETDAKLLLKLDKDAKAADTSRVDGRDSNVLKAWILEGTAGNSLQFNGQTSTQFTTSIMTQVNTALGNVYTKTETDSRLLAKLNRTDAATDTLRFGGRDDITFKDWVLEGTAANATKFGNKTYAEVLAEFQSGTVANSTRLNNMSFTQLEDYFDAKYARDNGKVVLPDLEAGPGNTWVCFGVATIKAPGEPKDDIDADGHLLIGGGDPFAGPGSPLLNMRVSVRGTVANPATIEVTSGSSVPTDLKFGYALTPDGKFANLWVRSANGRNAITILQLVSSSALNIGDFNTVTAEPAGIKYSEITGGVYATQADLEQVLVAMTQSYNQLAAALA